MGTTQRNHRRSERAARGRIGLALAALLLCTSAQAERRERGRKHGEERLEQVSQKDSRRLERRMAKLRRHEAYELGRREALGDAAERCADPGKGKNRLAMTGAALVGDWRVTPLYTAPRARRIFVNGYNGCLRAHNLDPRYRGDLPVAAPEAPPIEEDLPRISDEEKAFLEAHSGQLWEDGAGRCEQDLKQRR